MLPNIRPALIRVLSVACIVPVILTGLCAVTSAADNTVSGIWLTQAGDAKVQVRRCGAGVCGKVIWLREPIDKATRRPQVDDKNQNPALQRRPIIGLQLFAMQPAGPNTWSGRIYNADDGHSYASTVTFIEATRLQVRGCVGAFCGSETWTRTR